MFVVTCYPNLTTTFNVILESNDIEKNAEPAEVNKTLLLIHLKNLFDQTQKIHLHKFFKHETPKICNIPQIIKKVTRF